MELKISEVSKKYDISISTLHYYEKEGMIPQIKKNESGIRLYSKNDLEWIELICCLRQTGMSVKEIKYYVELCSHGKSTVLERFDIIRNQKKHIEEQMEMLKKSYAKICEKEAYYIDKINENKDAINPSKAEKCCITNKKCGQSK